MSTKHEVNITNPVLCTRVTPQERTDFDTAAKKHGMERGDYLAYLVREAVYGTAYAKKYLRVLQKFNKMTRADFVSLMVQETVEKPRPKK